MASSRFKELMSRLSVPLVHPEGVEWIRQEIEKLRPNYAVTFAFNKPGISHEYARRVVTNYFQNLDRKLSGKYYWQRPSDRIDGYLIPEKWDRNPHFHALLWVPPHAINKFEYRATKFWKQNSSHTINIQQINDLTGAINYATKSIRDQRNFDNFLRLPELWKRNQ